MIPIRSPLALDRSPTAGRRPIGRTCALVGSAAATVVLAAATLPSTAPLAAQTFTVEDVLSAPFPTELVAAPTGARVAWVRNDRGARNVWAAEGPDFRGRAVTSYERDDGQEITNLQFTPNGSALIYVRGGAPNRDGYVPNPASDPDGATRAIWIVDMAGGEPRRLAEGASPVVSPAGDVVAFSRGGQIWTVPVSGGEPAKLLDVRGGAGQPVWSPDGSRVAVVSGRGDHAFVGVFTPADSTLVWMAPGVDHDGDPAWSPDGSRLAFLRVPNMYRVLPFEPVRVSHPFSILVGDPSTGEAREVWRADDGRGSAFHAVDAATQLWWAAGDRLVFPWERTGWAHLWSVPASGGEATELTPGAFEVQFAAVTPDRREMLVSTNQDDIDRRHLWRVPVDGASRPRAVTPGDGIEWTPAMAADGSALAFLASGATFPARAVVTVGDGAPRPMAPTPVPTEFPEEHLVEPEQVIFPGTDGMPIHAQLFLPAGHRAGERHPAVLFLHGGSRRQMLLGFHHRGYYHNAYAFNQLLASRGYVVLSVNYRSGVGYGLEFREALDYGATGGSEFRDVMGAGLYLAHRDDVDPERIGLWGGSYGGYLTAMGLSRASNLFKAGVDVHGVHDWNQGIYNFRRDYDRGQHPEFAELAFESSPMATVDRWTSPVLLIHGDDDRNVMFSETVELAEELRKRDVLVETLVFPDEVHGFLRHESWVRAYEAAIDFFDRFIGPGAETSH
jgi:dipeptidyl aminopeptidase/acylaminoacyl peptidase